MAAPVEFYFEFASPYGYLASTRIDALAAEFGRAVAWRPIMLGPMMKATGSGPLLLLQPVKGDYALRDIARFARLLGVQLTMPEVFPLNSLAASRAYWWLVDDDPALAKRLAQAVFAAHWGEGRDMSTPATVAEVAAPLGIVPDELLAAVTDPKIKQRLKDETQAAADKGVFGSPFILIDSEPFWGADRLDQVRLWLQRGGW
jgi:2-hydroxychromene-2-carboxylate isomerase